jgi:3-isopropylmalate dehydrogenase
MARELNLALIPGDGIGTEVVAEAMKVLEAVAPKAGFTVSATEYDLGATRYNATGELLPESVIEELRTYDAILLGAIGDPSVPPGVLERGVLLPLRFVMDHHVNLRPVKLYPGCSGAAGWRQDDRLRRLPRRHRGALRGSRWRAAQGNSARSGDRGEPEHGLSAWSGSCAMRSTGRARRKHVTLVHKTNVLDQRGLLVEADLRSRCR